MTLSSSFIDSFVVFLGPRVSSGCSDGLEGIRMVGKSCNLQHFQRLHGHNCSDCKFVELPDLVHNPSLSKRKGTIAAKTRRARHVSAASLVRGAIKLTRNGLSPQAPSTSTSFPHTNVLADYIMDSFVHTIAFIEDISASVPANEENGGNGGYAYCVVA
ncbi:hypothetical protein BD779DRAFT_1564928 [Infundibulicybe gibba]|nr:hypothetical protein BD779DRAFT_1564928 [Infundibulicybe gibba]